MGRAFVKEERRTKDRGRRQAERREAPARHGADGSASCPGTVAHVVAHPADVLSVGGVDVLRPVSAPARPSALICFAPGDAAARTALLDTLGKGGAWTRHAERLPGGTSLEIHTLSSAPYVEVCFADAAQWLGPGAQRELTGCAVELLERFSPAMLRTLDPDPEHTGWDGETASYADHPEHTAVAQAVLEAVRLRADRPDASALVVECFRAAAPCDASAPQPAVPRYPGGRIWLTRGADDRLTVYAALGGGIVRWTEDRPGGPDWTEQRLLSTPPLLPVLAVAQSPEGWVHLVSLRRTPDASAGGAEVEVMHAVQYQTGRPVAPWRSLGNPNGGHRTKGREVGVPAVVVDGNGCPHIFARNFGRGVSSRSQRADGSWGPWTDRQGTGVNDGLAAVLDERGRPELFAPTDEGVIRWYQGSGKGGLVRSPDLLPLRAARGSALAARRTGSGITVYGSDAGDGALLALRTDGTSTRIGDAAGHGVTLAQASVDGYDCTVLLRRAPEGETAIAAYPTDDENPLLWWERTGGPGVRGPAAAIDAYGRLVVASLDPDGRLRVARQDTTAEGLLLGAWATA
ncbi:hypothetical protein [Streptomyces sp. NPDC002889]|uniref:hypothetical protein n=1 Tax=Streptomyces sp. NPDC002889 TaxID=3364669 RepID=UPI0036B07519